jgi:hypothetical protein
MGTHTNPVSDEHDHPVPVWDPMCRDLALALVTARSDRFSDWDVDQVTSVAVKGEVE